MELTLAELKTLIRYIINNNERLQQEGDTPVAINICAEAGVGR